MNFISLPYISNFIVYPTKNNPLVNQDASYTNACTYLLGFIKYKIICISRVTTSIIKSLNLNKNVKTTRDQTDKNAIFTPYTLNCYINDIS